MSRLMMRYSSGDLVVSCVEYDTGFGASYELGLRDRSIPSSEPGHFHLIQGHDFNSANIGKWGACAISLLKNGVHPSVIANAFHSMDQEESEEKTL